MNFSGVLGTQLQLKSRLVRTSGATRVQTYRRRQTQLELILTHTAGHLLVMLWKFASGLYQLVKVIMMYREAEQSMRWNME